MRAIACLVGWAGAVFLLSPHAISAQICESLGGSAELRVVSGIGLEGHAYGSSNLVFIRVRPHAVTPFWLTVGAGNTADDELSYNTTNLATAIGLETAPLMGFVVCPSVSLLREHGTEEYLGSPVDLRYRYFDWGFGVSRPLTVSSRVEAVATARHRAGSTLLRRHDRVDGIPAEFQRWRYGLSEVLLGIAIDQSLAIRLSVAFYSTTWAKDIGPFPPVARADGEVGFGLTIAYLF